MFGFHTLQSQDIEAGVRVKLKTEEVISMLAKSYSESYIAADVANRVAVLSKQV
jgi:hypothetical protein